MSKAVIEFTPTDTGLVIGDLTIDWCKTIAAQAAVSQTGITLAELGNGCYVLNNPNVAEDTAFRVYVTADATKYSIGVFSMSDGDLAKESTLLALQTVGGVITALVDIGQEISSALLPIVMEKGEKKIITVQVLEGGAAKDCTGLTAKLGVKEKLTDTTYKIGPIDGVFSNDGNGVKSILTFTILPAATSALAGFGGLYSAAIYDGAGDNKVPISDRGGVAFTLREDILDVV